MAGSFLSSDLDLETLIFLLIGHKLRFPFFFWGGPPGDLPFEDSDDLPGLGALPQAWL